MAHFTYLARYAQKRKSLMFVLFGGIVLCVLVSVVVALRMHNDSTAVAVTPQVKFTPSLAQPGTQARVVYMTSSGGRQKVYSAALTGGDTKVLYEGSVRDPREHSVHISPDGRYIAISTDSKTGIIIDSQGHQSGVIPGQFETWALDGTAFIYTVHHGPANAGQFACVKAGPECWQETYLYTIPKAKSSLLFDRNHATGPLTTLGKHKVIDAYGTVTDLTTKASRTLEGFSYPDSVSASPNDAHVLLVDRDGSRCTIYELDDTLAKRTALLAQDNGTCGSLAWSNNDTFYFSKITSLLDDQQPRVGDILYAPHTVRRYSYLTHTTSDVLASNQATMYNFYAVVSEQYLAVAAINGRGTPAYRLELRSESGDLRATLTTGNQPSTFIGTIY